MIEARIAQSAAEPDGLLTTGPELDAWLKDCADRFHATTEPVPLAELSGWHFEPDTGNVVHDTGKFFRVEGLDVHIPGAPIERWCQPIISQPEVGILGILVKSFGGVLHCLMQAKVEPGNCNGVQLSPTVQATRSNYTGVHRGKPVPYLDYFRDVAGPAVIADVRQSEQGAWFRHKRNRNMVVETTADVPVLDGFCWMTIGQLRSLLLIDHLVNMDTRTVLGCLPAAGRAPSSSRHTMTEILSWITEARTRQDVHATPIPLRAVRGWRHAEGRISHERGLFFDVIGVGVHAAGREVGRWQQPMLAPHGTGLVALLIRRIGGVWHALMHARAEPGYLDVLELAPTVQCTPETYDALDTGVRPAFLDHVLAADPDGFRFDAVHSEEGGRFMHARTRYVVLETDLDVPPAAYPEHRWLTLHQLGALLRHSHYLNVQARSIVACLHSVLDPLANEGAHP
ncbi:MAG TPA: NDP-hexose 2,3-dehydratase family protein [Actinophytocola sp.]|uniref:NDP-hexose 2,3-dehydratase family protein n=1 Tax=Actinophytocola sp. TaxID=1872138 RepID=UPI002DBB025F|nr:NDP-hexose 2,3-dehydratase family protein [Actinophytocola sp.]HEU5471627.1 NDP-hexose 2,3-dehydratase family protein [Actinophytocola sp.]